MQRNAKGYLHLRHNSITIILSFKIKKMYPYSKHGSGFEPSIHSDSYLKSTAFFQEKNT